MASGAKNREKLVEFLDEKVFDPILKASGDETKLGHLKRSTENEKRRYHDEYRTASDVRNNYLSDLDSESGKRISRELEGVGLPTLPQVKGEFMKLCEELGVGPR
jgi:hypothetical protein